MTTETIYPLHALRRLALHSQGLDRPLAGDGPVVDTAAIEALVQQLGCVQIDTLQMVRRSHYLVLWSRLGRYLPDDFDHLIYGAQQRRLFEGWIHAACIVPVGEYRYQMPLQRRLREKPSEGRREWLADPANQELLQDVRRRISEDGAVRGGDFEYNGPKRDGWWDWKPAKMALEYLYATGELMISGRSNFQRLYDLTRRVLPDWVDTTEPGAGERDRQWVEMGVKALGVCSPAQAGDYTYRNLGQTRPHVEDLRADGTLQAIKGRLADGQVADLLVHRQNLPALQAAADGALQAQRTTFLSPFDSLFWARRRDEGLWGFRQALEAYVPAPKRIWGYFCLPILHGERLVGRFDPKLERKEGRLRLKALYLEDGVQPDEALVAGVAAAMRDFIAFHEARDLIIERSQPMEFGARLLAEL